MADDVEHLCGLNGHFYTFFGELFIQILCSFLIVLFAFLLLNCRKYCVFSEQGKYKLQKGGV